MQSFVKVFSDCHPAAKSVFALLDSLTQKNKRSFAALFGAPMFPHFFANLPGAVQVRDAKKLIDMHEEFFESLNSRFEYGELADGVGDEAFFSCSVPAKVTLPNGAVRRVYIDMTFFKSKGAWIPGRFINTVMDSSQVAIK